MGTASSPALVSTAGRRETGQRTWSCGPGNHPGPQSEQALGLARELEHPYSLAYALHWAADLYHHRREVLAVHVQAEALLSLATAQGFLLWVEFETYYHDGCWPCRVSGIQVWH